MKTARPDAPALPAPDQDKIAKALTYFRVMAIIVGFGLLLLVLEIVLKYGFGNDVLAWWAMPHGFLYMVYLGTVLNLGSAARFRLGRTVSVMLAGCVPLLSFWVEHRTTWRVRRQLAASRAAAA